MKRSMAWLLVPALVLAFALPILAAAIPGINAADKNAAGCVDCHKGSYSLSASVAKIKGHPKASDSPKSCVGCHSDKSKQPLGEVLHKNHLTSSKFVADYDDSLCTSCHKLDKTTGKWSVKGL